MIRCRVVERQRVSVTIKRAAETFDCFPVLRSRHRRDGDVGGQLHGLALIRLAAADALGEVVPVRFAFDEVGVVALALAVQWHRRPRGRGEHREDDEEHRQCEKP